MHRTASRRLVTASIVVAVTMALCRTVVSGDESRKLPRPSVAAQTPDQVGGVPQPEVIPLGVPVLSPRAVKPSLHAIIAKMRGQVPQGSGPEIGPLGGAVPSSGLAVPDVAPPKLEASDAAVPAAGSEPWRYRWHEGRWWYWMPDSHWIWWDRHRGWVDYRFAF